MFLFAAPMWLWVTGAVVAAGGWALLSGHRRVRAVSSVRLWKGLGSQAGESGRRRVDPVWLLVFLALVMAGIGLARPAWRAVGGQTVNSIDVSWAVRSVRAAGSPEETEIFVRSREGAALPGGEILLAADNASERISGDALRRGATMVLRRPGGEVTAALVREGKTLAQARFERPRAGGRPIGLFKVAGHELVIDPAIARAFAVRPGAEEGNAGANAGVVLVNDPGFSMSDLPENTVLVVAEPGTPLPGLVPGGRVIAEGSGWKPVAGRADDFLQGIAEVRVSARRAVELDATWSILASVDGNPWLASRQWQAPGSDKKIDLLWFASEPASETNWPKFASFVVFVGAWTDRALDDAGDGAGGVASPWVDWKEVGAGRAAEVEPGALGGWFGGISAMLAVVAAGWFLWRGRES